MKRSFIFLLVAIVLGLTSITAFLVYSFAAPSVLRIAVGPVGSEDTKAVVTILQTFAREKHPIRLRLVPSDGPTGSAELLKVGKADLAVVRSDGNVPPNAATVAILHRDALLIMAPEGRGIRSVADLAGRKIGIVRGFNLNSKLLDLILQHNGVDPAKTTKVSVRPGEVRSAIADGSIDVLLSVGPPSGSVVSQLHSDMFSAAGLPPVIVKLADAEAIAQRNPTFEVTTVLRGTFGGSPPRPSESVETIGVTHRIVADRGLKEAVVADLAKSLFDVRQTVAAEVPNFARIEAPNTEVLGPMVVHPGASSYFEGEQKTFIEQYGEWIYIGIMGFSLLGSLGAALLSRQFSHRRPAGTSEIDKMLLLLRRARAAATLADLDKVQQDADEAFGRTVERAADSDIDDAVLSAFTIALGEVRTAIDDRRRMLSHELMGLAG